MLSWMPSHPNCHWLNPKRGLSSVVIHTVMVRLYHYSGSLNVPIEHHPTIRYMVYNGYYRVMSNIPKMGQLPTPALFWVNEIIFH